MSEESGSKGRRYGLSYMLSNKDMENIIGESVPITPSSQFHKIKSIDELLSPSGKGLILYEDSRDGPVFIGHWCGLLRFSPNDIAFYDPYGGFPDSQLNYIPMSYRKATNQDSVWPHMKRLLHDSPYIRLHYNPYRHQQMQEGINTCGRHVAMFLRAACDPEIYNNVLNGLQMGLMGGRQNSKYKDKFVLDMTKNFIR